MLSDPQKRQIYDQFGEEGLKGGGMGGSGGGGGGMPGGFRYEFHGDPNEIFRNFFGEHVCEQFVSSSSRSLRGRAPPVSEWSAAQVFLACALALLILGAQHYLMGVLARYLAPAALTAVILVPLHLIVSEQRQTTLQLHAIAAPCHSSCAMGGENLMGTKLHRTWVGREKRKSNLYYSSI